MSHLSHIATLFPCHAFMILGTSTSRYALEHTRRSTFRQGAAAVPTSLPLASFYCRLPMADAVETDGFLSSSTSDSRH
jgi:hypothetical protein